jgi:hypothetical protein
MKTDFVHTTWFHLRKTLQNSISKCAEISNTHRPPLQEPKVQKSWNFGSICHQHKFPKTFQLFFDLENEFADLK